MGNLYFEEWRAEEGPKALCAVLAYDYGVWLDLLIGGWLNGKI